MSNDCEKPKPGETRGGVIPPELEPFLRKRQRPRTQRLGEDPELDAAAAAYRALGQEPAEEEPPVQDLSIGMGNASAYMAPVEVKAAKVPAKSEAADARPAKVEVALGDVPCTLPAGSRTAETAEMRVLRPRVGDEDDVTLQRDRTVGGGTARLAVVKAASPWANDAPVPLVAPVELPSAHAPSAEHAGGRPASGRRKRRLVLGAVLVGVAGLIAFRVATTGTEAPGD